MIDRLHAERAKQMKILNVAYRRLPDRVTCFPAVVLSEFNEGKIIFNILNPSKPLLVEDSILLDRGYIGVWFVSNRNWHDLGAIYDREKRFKGYYCDICTPLKRISDGYELTDFFLDLWIFPDGRFLVLDEKEFDRAVKHGWMSPDQTLRAKKELRELVDKIELKKFPTSEIKNMLTLPTNADEIKHALEQISKIN